MEHELLFCPFCGNNDFSGHSLKSIQLMETPKNTTCYGLKTEPYIEYCVVCHKCGAHGGTGITGLNHLTGRTITEAEARQIAIDKWNRRAPISDYTPLLDK